MQGFELRNGILHAEDLPLPELAARFGTPLYIYSAGRIRANITRLRAALEKALPADRQPLIAFACKANSNLAVLTLLGRLELGCDVVSGGEMTRSLAAGIPAGRIVYSGVGKSDNEIAAAIDSGLLQINVESRAELERIAGIAAARKTKARVAFRLNPDVAAATHDKISTGRRQDKFGMAASEISALYPWAARHPHLDVRGLQMHIGSQITDVTPFRAAFEKIAALTRDLRSGGSPVDHLDLGGGLGIVYRDENPPDLDAYAAMIRDIILPLDASVTLEPGRFVTGDAGILLCRVGYIKAHEDRNFLILDAGMNDLIRPALYDAYHAARPVREDTGANITYDVAGPVCETGDTFLRGCALPAMAAGDLVALMCAGAYGFVMASNYNTRPLPAECLVDGDKAAIIRRRQDIQDILKEETVPEWLL